MEKIRRRRLDAQTWRGIFERYGASELTVQAFCRTESISDKSFYRWRTRLHAPVDSGKTTMPAVHRGRVVSDFVDLGPLTQSRASVPRLDLKLDLGDGLMLHLIRG